MSTADLGIISGKAPNVVFGDIRRVIPPGTRRVPDREIDDAIKKAIQDLTDGNYEPRRRQVPVVQNGKVVLQKLISDAKISHEVDLWEVSPIRLMEEPLTDASLFLKTRYRACDRVFIGERHQPGIIGETIRFAWEWIVHIDNGGTTGPLIIINPLNGIPAPTKSGDKTTLRGDGNVTSYRYCMAEFDNLSREDQIRFWSAVKLPIVALIDSGGKSIHAWMEVSQMSQVTTSEKWQEIIKERLYDRLLAPLGVDAACSNPARLSRLPGHYRTEKQSWQRLLWLSPAGRPIC